MKAFAYIFILIVVLTYGASSFVALAISYTPMVDVPGLTGTELTTKGYVNALYYLSITVAGLLAVVQIIYGGVEWTFSDSFTEKSSAKARIQGSLLGLLIILSAVLILETVNKDLTTLNILHDAPSVTVSAPEKTVTGSCILPSSCDSRTETFVKYVKGGESGCGACMKTGFLNDPIVNDEDIIFTYGSVLIPTEQYDGLDQAEILLKLQNACSPGKVKPPVEEGNFLKFDCIK